VPVSRHGAGSMAFERCWGGAERRRCDGVLVSEAFTAFVVLKAFQTLTPWAGIVGMGQMLQHYVKALLMCASTGTLLKYCLPISKAVPTGLRCQPSEPGNGDGGLPPLCESCRRLALNPKRLQDLVAERASTGWDEHRVGAVVIGC
jgi:hypothetical protein